MEITGKVEGLADAIAAMEAAFPKNPSKQRSILNQSLSGAARKTIIPVAKQLAYTGDSSGALSESIAPRAKSKGRALAQGNAAGVEITPVRYNRKAIAMYLNHYYPNGAKLGRTVEGIRHGHLVEFGTKHSSAKPFLGPALDQQGQAFINQFAKSIMRKVEAAVRRRARKRVRR